MIPFDLPPELSGKDARFVIVPVPYERTTSYGKGTANGPAAILEASQQVELYDDELRSEPAESGIASVDPLDVDGTPEEVLARLEETVAGIAEGGRVPIVIGGEHSITPAAVRGVRRHRGEITVVQLDAHADLREEYDGTPLSHACAMARVRERNPAVQVGIRSLSAPEAERIESEKLPVFFARDMYGNDDWMNKAIASVSTDDIYVTIDVDAFDPSVIPNTGTPEPGGMEWYQTLSFLRKLMREKRVVGFDIVELSPRKGDRASEFAAAKLLYKCIGYSV
jgi:agmatinase